MNGTLMNGNLRYTSWDQRRSLRYLQAWDGLGWLAGWLVASLIAYRRIFYVRRHVSSPYRIPNSKHDSNEPSCDSAHTFLPLWLKLTLAVAPHKLPVVACISAAILSADLAV